MGDVAIIGSNKTYEVIGLADQDGVPQQVTIEASEFGLISPGNIGFKDAKGELVGLVPAHLIVRVKK